jgi:RND family efflux transporter MFP subunit
MEKTISCEAFAWFYLLAVGLIFVAARLTRGNSRSATGVALRGVARLPAWPDRIANRVAGRLTQTGPRCGRTGVRESDIPGLDGYARQFEEAIEKIRLRHQGIREWGDMRYTITFCISFAPALVLGLGLAGCARAPAGPPPAPPTTVSVSYPVERDVTNYADFTGRLEAVFSVEIRARVTGYLNRVYFKDGVEVNEGASLFEIDPRPYKVELDRAEATLAQQEAHLKRLGADYRRVSTLLARGSVSREEYDKYAGDHAESEAAVGIARANRDLAKLNFDFTEVRTPIGGLLSRRMVDPGNMVQADTTALTTIVSLDPMYLYFDIDERTVLKLRVLVRDGKLPSREEGAVVPILAALADEEGFPHKGVINFSDNKVNPRTGTLRVRGVIENPVVKGKNSRMLSPGLFARVRLPLGEPHRALLVTERAIDTDQGQKILYLVNAKNEVDSRSVRLGAIHDGLRAIEDGLKPGERVIVVGLQQVRPGAVVEPKLVDMPGSPPRGPGNLAVGAGSPGLTSAGPVRTVR